MSAAEEDTELRDLLIHTLENNGVLNKIKAELRASVFLALEEQERAENKPSLINESLRQFLATRDGRLVAGLLTDFLQHFHLDFTLAVLQPEACLPAAPEDRTATARELGLPGRTAPLLLELLALFQQPQREAARPQELPSLFQQQQAALPQELPPEHAAEAQARFRRCSRGGELGADELRTLFTELCPHFHPNLLERYLSDELAGAGAVDEQRFLAMYRRLFLQCRSVLEPPARSDHEDDDLEGDSFFDDPKPEKTYGGKANEHSHSSDSLKEKMASLELGAGHDDDYMDDFHSSSQKSEVSIGEDLEDELDELTTSEHKLEELTVDNSQLSDVADYLEDVS